MAESRSPQARRRSTGAHQRRRAALIRTTRPGTPCWRCLRPMEPSGGVWGRGLDADHSTPAAIRAGLPDALAHARCNQLAGAHLATRIANITDVSERARIAAEVDQAVNAKLRGEAEPSTTRTMHATTTHSTTHWNGERVYMRDDPDRPDGAPVWCGVPGQGPPYRPITRF